MYYKDKYKHNVQPKSNMWLQLFTTLPAQLEQVFFEFQVTS